MLISVAHTYMHYLNDVDLLQLQQRQTMFDAFASLGRRVVHLLRHVLFVAADLGGNIVCLPWHALKSTANNLLRLALSVPWSGVHVVDATANGLLDGANRAGFVQFTKWW